MSFGRRVCASRRVVLAVDLGELSILDPAVDLDKSDLAAYRESLWEMKHITLDGEPTWWTVKPLTRKQIRYAQTFQGDPGGFADFVTRAGLVKVENYLLEGDNGESKAMPPVAVKAESNLGELITDEWMTEVGLQTDLLAGLSTMIQEISEVHLPLPKPSARRTGP